MRYLLIFLVLFFTGCEVWYKSDSVTYSQREGLEYNTTNSDDEIEEDNSITIESNPGSFQAEDLGYTQWGVFKDDHFYTQEGIDDSAGINPKDVYDNYTGEGVTVAVIDDGFDVNHPDLQGRIKSTHNFSKVGNSSDVSHTYSDDYHGTAVAGIIAANADGNGIRGIAPNASLVLIKMADFNTDDEVIDMFQTAIDQGARIINCSWGTGEVSEIVEEYLNDISQNAHNGKGVFTVFASGNDNEYLINDESYIQGVIGVGATDHTGLRTYYSNYGNGLDVVAPGGGDTYGEPGIATLDPIGYDGVSNDNYNRYNETTDDYEVSFIGTSAAAPIVSGSLALLLESDPDLSFSEVMSKLQSTSDKIGLNVPYLLDVEVFSSNDVHFTGLLGSSNYSEFSLQVKSLQSFETNRYSVDISGGSWYVDTVLDNGTYSITLIDSEKNILATDDFFEVNSSKTNIVRSMKNDYYGYGKINLYNLINTQSP